MNRAEYANAIRDLLALEIDPAALLPPDDSADGFDNIADVLSLSPALLESYLSAADKISALSVGSPRTETTSRPQLRAIASEPTILTNRVPVGKCGEQRATCLIGSMAQH